MKKCSICGITKISDQFYTNNKKCKKCHSKEGSLRKQGKFLPERMCSRCELIRTQEHFPIIGKSLRAWCIDCESPYGTHWCFICKEHKAAEGFRHRANGSKCGDCRKEYERIRGLRRHYGITLEEYKTAHTAQNGQCWICKSDEKLVVDHNHSISSGFRALLCSTCNLGIGYFKDNPDLLTRANEYLSIFGFSSKEVTP